MKKYPSYKPSGIDWLGDIPEGWVVLPIKRIVSTPVTDGPHETPELFDEGIPFISAEAIRSNKIDFNKKRGFISESEHRRFCLKYHPRRDDIYMIKSGATTGNLAIVETDEEFSIWSPLAVIRVHIEKANARYVLLAMGSSNFQTSVQLFWSFGTQQNIGMNVIQNLVLPIPPLPEQQQIASFLDKKTAQIDTLIEKKQKMMELLKEKRAAIINHAVTKGLNPNVKLKPSGIDWLGDIPEGWTRIKIKYLSIVKRGASPRPIDDPKYFDDNGEYSWVRIADVTASGRYLESTKQQLSELGSSLSVKMAPGELFLSIAGTVGKPIITNIKCCIHDGFVYFPLLKINPEYLYYIFSGGEAYKGLGKWGTQLNLNTETVGDIHIALPPMNELQNIIAFLDKKTAQIDKFVEMTNKQIELLKEYRTTLISEVVTGKVDVRDEVTA